MTRRFKYLAITVLMSLVMWVGLIAAVLLMWWLIRDYV